MNIKNIYDALITHNNTYDALITHNNICDVLLTSTIIYTTNATHMLNLTYENTRDLLNIIRRKRIKYSIFIIFER